MKPIHVRLGTPVAPALTFLYVARSPAKFLRNWHSVLRLEGKRERAHALVSCTPNNARAFFYFVVTRRGGTRMRLDQRFKRYRFSQLTGRAASAVFISVMREPISEHSARTKIRPQSLLLLFSFFNILDGFMHHFLRILERCNVSKNNGSYIYLPSDFTNVIVPKYDRTFLFLFSFFCFFRPRELFCLRYSHYGTLSITITFII